ncbi:MAG: hypothetical protein ACLGI7_10325 [Gammaproteobacteria bacterium]
MNWKAVVLGAAIVIAGVLAYAFVVDEQQPTLGDRAGEAVEEVGDEIDDAN